MASGKSTLGAALAAAAGRPFVDLDSSVEADIGMPVSTIFATEGEAAFRRYEAQALRRATAEGAIVACGGGTPCNDSNMDYMLRNGLVVELKASLEVTVRRLCLAPGQRPLVDALLDRPDELRAKVEEMMAQRRPYYSRAHASFDSNHLETTEEIATSVALFIETFKGRM